MGNRVDETNVGIGFGTCFERVVIYACGVGHGLVGDVTIRETVPDAFVVEVGRPVRCDDPFYRFW